MKKQQKKKKLLKRKPPKKRKRLRNKPGFQKPNKIERMTKRQCRIDKRTKNKLKKLLS